MIKFTNMIIAAALTALIAAPASAQSIQYLGPHSTEMGETVNGGQGVLTYNELCREAFDGAQMCESIDILRSGSLPSGLSLQQWVKPTIVEEYVDGTGAERTVDVGGFSIDRPGGLSCSGWGSNDPGLRGLVINANTGRYTALSCSGFLFVACCKVSSGKK